MYIIIIVVVNTLWNSMTFSRVDIVNIQHFKPFTLVLFIFLILFQVSSS